jgi:hypothetical protein
MRACRSKLHDQCTSVTPPALLTVGTQSQISWSEPYVYYEIFRSVTPKISSSRCCI